MTIQTPGEAIVTAEVIPLDRLATIHEGLGMLAREQYTKDMYAQTAKELRALPQRVRELETIERNLTTLAEGYKRERDAQDTCWFGAHSVRLVKRAALARKQSHD